MTVSQIVSAESSYAYNKSIMGELNAVCAPFFENTPIKSFRYSEFIDPYNWMFLSTNDEIAKYTLLELKNTTPSFKSGIEDSIATGLQYFLWPAQTEDPLINKYNSLGVYHGFSIFEKTKFGGIRVWGFGSTIFYSSLQEFYIKNFDLIKKFAFFSSQKILEIRTKHPEKILTKLNGYDPLTEIARGGEGLCEFLKTFFPEGEMINIYKKEIHLSCQELKSIVLINRSRNYNFLETFRKLVIRLRKKLNLEVDQYLIDYLQDLILEKIWEKRRSFFNEKTESLCNT